MRVSWTNVDGYRIFISNSERVCEIELNYNVRIFQCNTSIYRKKSREKSRVGNQQYSVGHFGKFIKISLLYGFKLNLILVCRQLNSASSDKKVGIMCS